MKRILIILAMFFGLMTTMSSVSAARPAYQITQSHQEVAAKLATMLPQGSPLQQLVAVHANNTAVPANMPGFIPQVYAAHLLSNLPQGTNQPLINELNDYATTPLPGKLSRLMSWVASRPQHLLDNRSAYLALSALIAGGMYLWKTPGCGWITNVASAVSGGYANVTCKWLEDLNTLPWGTIASCLAAASVVVSSRFLTAMQVFIPVVAQALFDATKATGKHIYRNGARYVILATLIASIVMLCYTAPDNNILKHPWIVEVKNSDFVQRLVAWFKQKLGNEYVAKIDDFSNQHAQCLVQNTFPEVGDTRAYTSCVQRATDVCGDVHTQCVDATYVQQHNLWNNCTKKFQETMGQFYAHPCQVRTDSDLKKYQDAFNVKLKTYNQCIGEENSKYLSWFRANPARCGAAPTLDVKRLPINPCGERPSTSQCANTFKECANNALNQCHNDSDVLWNFESLKDQVKVSLARCTGSVLNACHAAKEEAGVINSILARLFANKGAC